MTITQGPTADIVMASSGQDAAAVEVIKHHHAQLAGDLAARVEALLATAGSGGDPFQDSRRQALDFLTGELAPHAAAEEKAL